MLPYGTFGSFFHLVSPAQFVIVELYWHICSKYHLDLSLAFLLWAGVISHFPRQQTLRQILMQAYSGINTFRGVKEAGMGRGRSWIAFQLPRKPQPISGNSGARMALKTCPEVALRTWPLYPHVSQVIGALRRGRDLEWGSSLQFKTNPTEGLNWDLSATNAPWAWGVSTSVVEGRRWQPLQLPSRN